jgi:hypothetical protein
MGRLPFDIGRGSTAPIDWKGHPERLEIFRFPLETMDTAIEALDNFFPLRPIGDMVHCGRRNDLPLSYQSGRPRHWQ